LGNKDYLKVIKAHDFVSLKPFEGASNKTSAIILKKGEKTEYPVPYIVWEKTKGTGKISTDKTLREVLSIIKKKEYKARPINSNNSAWQTYLAGTENLLSLNGINYYRARSGAYTSPYGVFWVEIKQVLNNNNLRITNNTKQGKRKIHRVEETIESDLVFPVVRGSDVKKWEANSKVFSLIVHGSNNKLSGFDESLMKRNWPRTYNYLTQFKEYLIAQAAYKRYHENQKHPFYSQYNIGPYTFANYKVIWNQMGNEINSCVISQINTPFGFKMVIPLHTTALIAVENELEAHYLCSIINSIPVKEFIKSFSSAGRGFGTPSVMEHVGIPKFDPQNSLHLKLAEISKQCHQLKLEGKEEEIKKLEKENDALVEELFGISHE